VHHLFQLLLSGVVGHEGFALEALAALGSGKPGLMDHLIRKTYLMSCDKVITFDKTFARLEGVELLETQS